VAELHHAHLDAAASSWIANGPPVALDTSSQMIELITASLMRAVTADRARYLAVFELRLESRRRPALADALGAVVAAALPTVAAHHAQLGLAVAVDRIPVLIQLYGGILFTLVTDPADHADPAAVRALVTAAVRGALS